MTITINLSSILSLFRVGSLKMVKIGLKIYLSSLNMTLPTRATHQVLENPKKKHAVGHQSFNQDIDREWVHATCINYLIDSQRPKVHL
jgi:hypothetical protein